MPDEQEFQEAALQLLRRVGKDKLVRNMTERFEAGAPARLSAMRASAEAGDLARTAASAHSVKSSAGQLGAVAFQRLCQEIEEAAERGDAERVNHLLAEAEPVLGRALEWLRSMTRDPGGHQWQE